MFPDILCHIHIKHVLHTNGPYEYEMDWAMHITSQNLFYEGWNRLYFYEFISIPSHVILLKYDQVVYIYFFIFVICCLNRQTLAFVMNPSHSLPSFVSFIWV